MRHPTMSMRVWLGGVLVLGAVWVSICARPAAAGETDCCGAFDDGMPTGPVIAGVLEGNLGTAHRLCGRNEVGLDVDALLLIDRPAFYGRLSVGGKLDGSVLLHPRLELFGAFEFIRYENVITPIATSATGLGVTDVGAAWQMLRRERWGLGLNGKVVLPTAAGIYRNAWPFGMDLGLAAQLVVTPRILLHVQASALASAVASKGAAMPRAGGAVTLGTELRPGRAFAFALDLHGGFGYRAPLDTLAVALALRFSDGKRFGFEIAGVVPFAGYERALVSVDLRASIRLGPITPTSPRPEPSDR